MVQNEQDQPLHDQKEEEMVEARPPITIHINTNKETTYGGIQANYGGPIIPDNISDFIVSGIAAVGGVKLMVDIVKAWVDDRKGRKIRFKIDTYELEIQGGVSERRIEETLEKFKYLAENIKEDDIRIIEP